MSHVSSLVDFFCSHEESLQTMRTVYTYILAYISQLLGSSYSWRIVIIFSGPVVNSTCRKSTIIWSYIYNPPSKKKTKNQTQQ